jgi:hypothetical protein
LRECAEAKQHHRERQQRHQNNARHANHAAGRWQTTQRQGQSRQHQGDHGIRLDWQQVA